MIDMMMRRESLKNQSSRMKYGKNWNQYVKDAQSAKTS